METRQAGQMTTVSTVGMRLSTPRCQAVGLLHLLLYELGASHHQLRYEKTEALRVNE